MRPKLAFVFAGVKALPANLLWRWPKGGLRLTWRGICKTVSGLRRGCSWTWRESWYRIALFLSLSRTSVRTDGVVALIAAIAVFSYVFLKGEPVGGRALLDICYRLVTLLMILFGMNMLTRERDRGTLELVWSQPTSRGGLVLMQLLSLTVWIALLLGAMFVIYGRFATAELHTAWVLSMSLSTGLCVGLLTVLVSTFCRQGIATGIVACLIIGAHYIWIPSFGPIALFFNPIPEAMAIGVDNSGAVSASISNRIFVLIFAGFMYDYLIRRLRRTARWFT